MVYYCTIWTKIPVSSKAHPVLYHNTLKMKSISILTHKNDEKERYIVELTLYSNLLKKKQQQKLYINFPFSRKRKTHFKFVDFHFVSTDVKLRGNFRYL
jgi:hypothetical protein